MKVPMMAVISSSSFLHWDSKTGRPCSVLSMCFSVMDKPDRTVIVG